MEYQIIELNSIGKETRKIGDFGYLWNHLKRGLVGVRHLLESTSLPKNIIIVRPVKTDKEVKYYIGIIDGNDIDRDFYKAVDEVKYGSDCYMKSEKPFKEIITAETNIAEEQVINSIAEKYMSNNVIVTHFPNAQLSDNELYPFFNFDQYLRGRI